MNQDFNDRSGAVILKNTNMNLLDYLSEEEEVIHHTWNYDDDSEAYDFVVTEKRLIIFAKDYIDSYVFRSIINTSLFFSDDYIGEDDNDIVYGKGDISVCFQSAIDSTYICFPSYRTDEAKKFYQALTKCWMRQN